MRIQKCVKMDPVLRIQLDFWDIKEYQVEKERNVLIKDGKDLAVLVKQNYLEKNSTTSKLY